MAIGTTRTWLFSWYTRNYCALPSLACATTKIEELIATGQMEVVKDICRWNPSLDALPQVMYRVLSSDQMLIKEEAFPLVATLSVRHNLSDMFQIF